jgi:hypothetical protein
VIYLPTVTIEMTHFSINCRPFRAGKLCQLFSKDKLVRQFADESVVHDFKKFNKLAVLVLVSTYAGVMTEKTNGVDLRRVGVVAPERNKPGGGSLSESPSLDCIVLILWWLSQLWSIGVKQRPRRTTLRPKKRQPTLFSNTSPSAY